MGERQPPNRGVSARSFKAEEQHRVSLGVRQFVGLLESTFVSSNLLRIPGSFAMKNMFMHLYVLNICEFIMKYEIIIPD